ncbi:hypothetical protein TIFTF001_029327 [Ficus carica]|uniref:Uncharacterized protein n=1 Tax=Ficus carica TaxID=3494 RepID=A0AA88J381_FICCA|nr:hypothetical protein TIFTF001_029327 [Ficus carica]
MSNNDDESPNPNPNNTSPIPIPKPDPDPNDKRFQFPARADEEENMREDMFGILVHKDPKPYKFTIDEMDPKPFYVALINDYRRDLEFMKEISPFDLTRPPPYKGCFAPIPHNPSFSYPPIVVVPSDPKDDIAFTVAKAGVEDLGLEDFFFFFGGLNPLVCLFTFMFYPTSSMEA